MVNETKVCIKCWKELPMTREFFHTNSRNSTWFVWICRDCKNARDRAYRTSSTKTIFDYIIERWWCAVCWEMNPVVIDFHHTDPDTKETEVSSMLSMNRKIPRIIAEMDKCTLLCKNCHAKLHAKADWWKMYHLWEEYQLEHP